MSRRSRHHPRFERLPNRDARWCETIYSNPYQRYCPTKSGPSFDKNEDSLIERATHSAKFCNSCPTNGTVSIRLPRRHLIFESSDTFEFDFNLVPIHQRVGTERRPRRNNIPLFERDELGDIGDEFRD